MDRLKLAVFGLKNAGAAATRNMNQKGFLDMLLLIENGTVINPGDGTELKADVLVEDGKINILAL